VVSIKDEATQSVRRGTFRVFGRVKVTFAVVLACMAANLLEVARWQAMLSAATDEIRGPGRPKSVENRTPRRLTLRREAEKARIAKRHAKQAETDAESPKTRVLTSVPDPPPAPKQ